MILSISIVGSIDWPHVGRVLSASIAPLAAVIVTYIAVAQYFINRRQYRLALFEKRMAVFNSTMNMIASVMRSANPSLDECMQFIRDTRDHELLFGSEVGDFINEVFRRATLFEAQIAAESHTAAQRIETMQQFANQMGEARKIFLKYLDFRRP